MCFDCYEQIQAAGHEELLYAYEDLAQLLEITWHGMCEFAGAGYGNQALYLDRSRGKHGAHAVSERWHGHIGHGGAIVLFATWYSRRQAARLITLVVKGKGRRQHALTGSKPLVILCIDLAKTENIPYQGDIPSPGLCSHA